MKGWTHLAMSMFGKDRGTGDHKSILNVLSVCVLRNTKEH